MASEDARTNARAELRQERSQQPQRPQAKDSSCFKHKQIRCEENKFSVLKFRPDAARADKAPLGGGLNNGEDPRHHQNQAPQRIVADNDAGDEAKRADDAARDPPLATQIGPKEFAHARNTSTSRAKSQATGHGGLDCCC